MFLGQPAQLLFLLCLAILGLSYQLQDWEKQCIQLGDIKNNGKNFKFQFFANIRFPAENVNGIQNNYK